jgi:very-short-patch-repair endonuclease
MAKAKLNVGCLLMEKFLRELGLIFEREFHFCRDRRWKADFHIPKHRLLIEVHGSVYTQGGHTRGKGFEDDREKMNTAQMMGYKVLEFSTGQVESGEAKAFIERYL